MANVAIVQDGYDKEDPLRTLKLVTKPIPKPAPGQVVVHIKLRPINPTDFITLRSGAISKGGTSGSEGYGVVYEVSSNLRRRLLCSVRAILRIESCCLAPWT
jgi:NADPH:quinone reductase-like Zn-dependent oxidoreductase